MGVCIVNLGLYRTGLTSLAKAAEELDMRVHKDFPDLQPETLKAFLFDPTTAINDFISKHSELFVNMLSNYDFVCDGWFPLLALASKKMFGKIVQDAKMKGVHISFIATERMNVDSYVESELHHWIRHDIEKRAHLNFDERSRLEEALRLRYKRHSEGIKRIKDVIRLDLSTIGTEWAHALSAISVPKPFSVHDWQQALSNVGKQNSSPDLPVQGVLLTMRIVKRVDECLRNTKDLLEDLEKDSLCTYMLVLALDDDEYDSEEAERLKAMIEQRPRIESLHLVRNSKRVVDDDIPICHIWDAMAKRAWLEGAMWVIFLGDDVRINCPFHYRAIYRSFLDIQETLGLPSLCMFGCPWFNDEGFKGFPTFPVVGKEHCHIFQGLIPQERRSLFVNQDLDPYLQRLYVKFGAAPLLADATLTNGFGGSATKDARYKRIPASSWRDEVLNDVSPITSYLEEKGCNVEKHVKMLVDVVIPSHRVKIEYVRRLCSLSVPSNMRTTFIVIVDNPTELIKLSTEEFGSVPTLRPNEAASLLEDDLVKCSSNNIRVRCNDETLGASASRNRGINESAAEYILFLDDDVIPSSDLLTEYGTALQLYAEKKEDILGLVGLVRFPRDENIPLLHAGVLMSYLVFMFEIAENAIYSEPAWGVTANILFKRIPGMQFDTRYAKTGGGEDVDFALQLLGETGLKLRSVPTARVDHAIWNGGMYSLCKHFFNWAIGDGALFRRWEDKVYPSFPNIVETWLLLVLPIAAARDDTLYHLIVPALLMFFADVAVDASWKWGAAFRHRRGTLVKETPFQFSLGFVVSAHILANFYVVVLECGRLYGHVKRGHCGSIMHRFDWHCGCLPNSRRDFVVREGCKFLAFVVAITVACIAGR